jgi:hypothetical protein
VPLTETPRLRPSLVSPIIGCRRSRPREAAWMGPGQASPMSGLYQSHHFTAPPLLPVFPIFRPSTESAFASCSGFPPGVHVCPQRKKLLAGRALYGVLDFPVACEERQAKGVNGDRDELQGSDARRHGPATRGSGIATMLSTPTLLGLDWKDCWSLSRSCHLSGWSQFPWPQKQTSRADQSS